MSIGVARTKHLAKIASPLSSRHGRRALETGGPWDKQPARRDENRISGTNGGALHAAILNGQT